MYKCTECGQIYQTKPDYCDCGNNDFLEIKEQKHAEYVQENIPQKARIPFEKSDIISWSIFAVCVVLALLIWIFAWNEQPEPKTKQTPSSSVQKTEIPDIDTIWNDELPSPVEQKKNEEPVNQEPAEQEPQVIKIIKNVIVQPQETPAPSTKKEEKQEVKTTKNRPQKPEKAKTPEQVKNTKQTAKAPVPKQTSAQKAADEEIKNYKVALRSALFSNLKVTSVKGEGRCEVSFALDSTGKLINRNFSKLSDNKSMNDAVYYMFMSLPQYYPPPKSYKGEQFTMTFYINDGYYEINYK